MIFLEQIPGIIFLALVRKGNALGFGINGFYGNFDFLTDGNNFGGVFNAFPGQFGIVNHTVDTAEIHKRAVCRHALDNAGNMCADFKTGKGGISCGFTRFFAFGSADNANRTDGGFSAFVQFRDNEALGRSAESVEIRIFRGIGKGSGNKDLATGIGYANTALYNFGNGGFDDLAGLFCGFDNFPAGVAVNTFFRECGHTLAVVYANNESADFVAGFEHGAQIGGHVVRGLFFFDHAGDFGAEIEINGFIVDSGNNTVYDFSCM